MLSPDDPSMSMYRRASSRYCSSRFEIVSRSCAACERFALMLYWRYDGTATAARIDTTVTTIMSSIKLKPVLLALLAFTGPPSWQNTPRPLGADDLADGMRARPDERPASGARVCTMSCSAAGRSAARSMLKPPCASPFLPWLCSPRWLLTHRRAPSFTDGLTAPAARM